MAAQQASDDSPAMQEAGKSARRVCQRLGLTQQELSQRIDVSLETIRNWEQGKRSPTGQRRRCCGYLTGRQRLLWGRWVEDKGLVRAVSCGF